MAAPAIRRTSKSLKEANKPLQTITTGPQAGQNRKPSSSHHSSSHHSPSSFLSGPAVTQNPIKAKRNSEPDSRIDTPEPSKPSQSYHASTKKRARDPQPDHSSKRQKKTSSVSSADTLNPVSHWIQEGRWPSEYFESEGIMSFPLAQKKSYSSLWRKSSESRVTPSDQRPREEKSLQYTDPRYEEILETKGSFMDEHALDITSQSKVLSQNLLVASQNVPADTLFRDDIFKKTFRKLVGRNEEMVIQDIGRLIVPSAQNMAIFGATHLDKLIESVNEGWNESIPLTRPRPQPDYSVGFRPSAFTEDQRKRLEPCIGGLRDSSYFVASWRMWFPFLTCEVKCGAVGLDVADRQNAHSATLAVRAVVELYRAVNREKELHQEILAFSISHDNRDVRIYGHYPIIDQKETTYYRRPIETFPLTRENGKEKWTAYKFTKNVYDIFMPLHLERICSAVDELPLNPNFQVSQQSELRFPGDSGPLSRQSEASVSALDEQESRASFIGSGDATPNTTFTEQQFKKPRHK